MKLFSFQKIPSLIALITFLARTGFFMSLPFLAIYLAREGKFSAGQIGIILGASALIYSATSLINGMVIEHFSKRKTFITSLVIAGFCYVGISFSSHFFWPLFLLNGLLGWIRSVGDLASVTLLIQNSNETHLRSSYNLRFIAINTGAMVGPLIGSLFAYQKSLVIFIIAGMIHMVLAVYLFFTPIVEPQKTPETHPSNIFKNLKIILSNSTLLNMTCINLFIWIIYSQLDTTLPQYLTHITQHSAFIIAYMLFINALVCITLSSSALRFSEAYSIRYAGVIGSFLMCFGFVLLAFFTNHVAFILAAIATSVAELLTVLGNGLIVSKIAPKHLVSSYNGFLSLGSLGLCIGPVLGGYGLQFLGGKYTFLILTFFPLICVWLYSKVNYTLK